MVTPIHDLAIMVFIVLVTIYVGRKTQEPYYTKEEKEFCRKVLKIVQ